MRAIVFLLALLASAAALAAPSSYTGEAPVNSQSDEERSGALKTALANVVAAQTGDSGLLARPDVAKAVEQAERYVLQYQYRRGDDSGAKYLLVAQFDSTAVNQMLQRLGLGPAGAQTEVATEAPSEATVWIGGINNANDYARLVGYLARNNFVRNAQPMEARGDGVLVRLSLVSGLTRFLEVVAMERTLGVVAGAKVEGVDATLALTP
ncbi:DUF2066 domain-containing protein [Dokdonella ginsengisoli]|uniref:DUF2066 domain-containing protein n=1 Tax=Dokdonella ginsengisoli TaxID=363846 RepID=A0ABV9QRI8_9GAMM